MSRAPEPRARERFPDQLRGLALLGIVVVNAPYLAISSDGYTDASLATPVDEAVAMLTTIIAEGKFYLLFSFLFGYSTNFIVKGGGPPDRRRYRRRLMGLAVIGLVHAIFLFIGDILLSYAILGSGLLLLTRRPDRIVYRAAAISAVVGLAWLALVAADAALSSGLPGPDPSILSLDAALADGTFWDTAAARLAALPSTLLVLGSLQWGLAFAAFCLGLVAGRRHLLGDLKGYLPLFRRLALWGLLVGLPLQAAATWISFRGERDGDVYVGLAVALATAPILSAGYLGGLALLSWHRPRSLAFMQPPGRASLTVYIGESVVLCVIFCGWGFGFFGSLGAAAVTAIAVATWAALAGVMHVWSRHFRHGPLESALALWTGPARPTEAAGRPR